MSLAGWGSDPEKSGSELSFQAIKNIKKLLPAKIHEKYLELVFMGNGWKWEIPKVDGAF